MISITWGCRLLGLPVLVFSLVANATPVPTYRVVDLGFTGTALNNRGQVAGYSSAGAILRDRNGATHYLGGGSAVDVNEFGQVLGNENGRAWIWDPVFGRRDFAFGGATALNDRGQFVGWVGPGIGTVTGLDSEGYLWDPIFGLTPMPESSTHAAIVPLDINNHSTIASYSDAGPGPFVVKNGVPTRLTLEDALDGVFGFAYRAHAINERGEIVGLSMTANLTLESGVQCFEGSVGGECEPAVLWSPDLTPQLLGVIGAPFAISDRGQVVGRQYCDACIGHFNGAFLWDRNFGALDINTLIRLNDPLRAYHFGVAAQINNSGMIIAGAESGPGVTTRGGSYLLIRVPEPSLVAMLGLALLALGLFHRLRERLVRSHATILKLSDIQSQKSASPGRL